MKHFFNIPDSYIIFPRCNLTFSDDFSTVKQILQIWCSTYEATKAVPCKEPLASKFQVNILQKRHFVPALSALSWKPISILAGKLQWSSKIKNLYKLKAKKVRKTLKKNHSVTHRVLEYNSVFLVFLNKGGVFPRFTGLDDYSRSHLCSSLPKLLIAILTYFCSLEWL